MFSTPIFQRPLALGAHTVVYSATKHIDGQGRCLGGVVLSDEEWVEEKLFPYLKHTGPSLSPFNAWVLVKALETLEIRVDAADENRPRRSRRRLPTIRRSSGSTLWAIRAIRNTSSGGGR